MVSRRVSCAMVMMILTLIGMRQHAAGARHRKHCINQRSTSGDPNTRETSIFSFHTRFGFDTIVSGRLKSLSVPDVSIQQGFRTVYSCLLMDATKSGALHTNSPLLEVQKLVPITSFLPSDGPLRRGPVPPPHVSTIPSHVRALLWHGHCRRPARLLPDV